MHDQTRSLIAAGIFVLTILIVVFIARTRSRQGFKTPSLVQLVLSACFLAITALTWSLCYMGFVSGVMVSIDRWRSIENDSASTPTSYWIALAFAYVLGVVFLWIGALILHAPRTEE